MSWFWRGFQSAIFYYISCAPCATYAHQRKRQKASRRAKAEKTIQEQTEAGVYHHPSPFNTNVYWHEEITLGPGPPPQRKGNKDRSKTDSARRLNTGGQGSSAGGSSGVTTLALQSLDGMEEVQQEGLEDDSWNRRRYQRADDVLWGLGSTQEEIDPSTGMPDLNRPTTSESGTYYTARNPAVNDLHPPIVSTQPRQKSETRWMLQPPPPAKVMEGKERANRSRSISGGSYGSTTRASERTSLSRQVSQGRRSQEPRRVPPSNPQTIPIHHNPSQTGSIVPKGQRHDRDYQASSDSDASILTPSRKRRPPPIKVSEELDDPSPHSDNQSRKSRQDRPALATIESSSQNFTTLNTTNLHADDHLSRISSLRPKPTSMKSNSSLHVLQELVPSGSSLNTMAHTPSKEALIRLPSATEDEDRELAFLEVEMRFPGAETFRFPAVDTADGRD